MPITAHALLFTEYLISWAGRAATWVLGMSVPMLSGPGTMSLTSSNRIGDARRLELLVNAIVDYAIFMLDTEGRVRTWNAGAERLKGYSSDEIIGKLFATVYTPEDRDQGLPATALAAARETGRFHSEGWRVRKNGSRLWRLM